MRTTHVYVSVALPDGTLSTADYGTMDVPIRADGTINEHQFFRNLGGLLVEAGEYLQERHPADPPPGGGESGSPG
ncbi:hypothetical protein [Streptomyces sp. DW26H14]|uniref:hypothetical protein n=1 Tax=Streptomyces sp. DW26H14 TaxID=3435395 RepID=UPI00403E0F30